MATALGLYRANYKEQKSWFDDSHGGDYSKYTWAAHNIFNLTTYDDWLDEVFVKDIIEVCKVILEDRNYEYIKNEQHYIKYILVCQMFENFRWIEWGTSIRGAWFQEEYFKPFGSDEVIKSRDILEELEWGEWNAVKKKHEKHVIDTVPFTVENIKALVEFMTEETKDVTEEPEVITED